MTSAREPLKCLTEVAACALLKWQIAQRSELGKRVKKLYQQRDKYSVLKRWFIEKIYFEMMPKELPVGLA